VPTDQIEPETSDWGQILSVSAPGTYVIGKSSDGKFYEVAVCSSYFPWLVSHEFEFELGLHYDLTEPVDAEIQLYGRSQAIRRAQAHFLESLTTGISSGRGRRFEQYCRRIAPDQLQIPLERAILNHHVRTQWFPLCMLQSSKSFLVGASAAALSAMHALICRIQFFFPPALWYDFWTVVSGVMLYARYDQIGKIFDS